MRRPLSKVERDVVLQVAERLSQDERVRLLRDVSEISEVAVSPNSQRIEFYYDGYHRPKSSGQRSYGVGGCLLDADGEELSLDVFCDENGRLFEIEILRWGDSPIVNPQWNTVRFY